MGVFTPVSGKTAPNVSTLQENQSDFVPGLRRLRLFLYSRRPDSANFKTRSEEWTLLRSQWRFLHSLYPYLGPPSNLILRLFFPLLCCTLVALGCCIWDKQGDYNLNQGKTFLLVFRLTSFCMSLLLSVRLNRVYDRWWMARSAFSGVGQGLLSLMRHAHTCCTDDVLLAQLHRWSMLWQFSLLQCVRDEALPDKRALSLLSEEELEIWAAARKPRHLAQSMVTLLIRDAPDGSFKALKAMEQQVAAVAAAQSICVRIHYSAMPYAITLHCTGFVFIWCLLLPFGLYPGGSYGAIFATLLSSTMLLGTDEVSNQLENPFPHMPLEELIVGSLRDLERVGDDIRSLRSNDVKAQALLRACPGYVPPPLCKLPLTQGGGNDYAQENSNPDPF